MEILNNYSGLISLIAAVAAIGAIIVPFVILKKQRKLMDSEQAYSIFIEYFDEYLHQIFAGKEIRKVDDKDESKALLKNVVISIVRQIYLEELLRHN